MTSDLDARRSGASSPSRTASPRHRADPATGSGQAAPRTLGDWIPQVLQEMGLDAAHDAAQLRGAWDEAVGPDVAAHSRPQGIRRGVVHASVPDSAWLQRLQLEKVGILERLRRRLPDTEILDLRLRIT